MSDIKLLRIEGGDSQKELIDKVNSNFLNLISFGGGPYGKVGKRGPQGNKGITGPRGSFGDMGQRGNIWSVTGTEPSSGQIDGDFWMDTSDFNKVYQYASGSWELYGSSITSQDLFRIAGPLRTSTGISSKYSYSISALDPINYTFVLSDNNFDSSPSGNSKFRFNPQYSKFVISTNSNLIGRKIIEFTKSEYSGIFSFYSKTPGFLFTNPIDYSLTLTSPDGLFLETSRLGLSSVAGISINSNGININTSSLSPLSITSSSGNVIFDFSTGGTGYFSTSNISYGGSFFSMPVSLRFNSESSDLNSPLWISATGTGASNLRHRTSSSSSPNYSLFRGVQENPPTVISGLPVPVLPTTIVEVFGDGTLYYDKKVDSFMPPSGVIGSTSPASSTTVPVGSPLTPVSVNWYTIVPAVSLGSSLASNQSAFNNGIDIVLDPPIIKSFTADIGISLWTENNGPTGNNGGWLSLLEPNESLTIRIKLTRRSDLNRIRFLGLNTGNQNSLPYSGPGIYPAGPESYTGNPQFVDLIQGNSTAIPTVDQGAIGVEFTIMNIAESGATAGSRWFKVFYSAWGNMDQVNFPTYGLRARYASVVCGYLCDANSMPY